MTTQPVLMEMQMQIDRMSRAQLALKRGEMSVASLAAHQWAINSHGSSYTVTRNDQGWACTCPDFNGRCQRFGLFCKHIAAVQLIQIDRHRNQPEPNTRSRYTEETMSQTQTLTAPILIDATTEIVTRLRQPLDMNRVKRRQAPGMGSVPYLEGYDVIEAANDLFRFRWSFELSGEPRIMRWDRVVTFYDQRLRKKMPLLGEDGKAVTEVSGIVYVTGRVMVELEGAACAHADVGRCVFSGDSPEALDMALAGAATDCLKRCFRQLGEQFGNSLYDKEVAKTAGFAVPAGIEGAGQPETPPEPPRPAESQAETLRYQDGAAVDAASEAERSAFKAFQTAHHNQIPANREALRAWTNKNNTRKQ